MLASLPWVRSEETGLRPVGTQPGVVGLRQVRQGHIACDGAGPVRSRAGRGSAML